MINLPVDEEWKIRISRDKILSSCRLCGEYIYENQSVIKDLDNGSVFCNTNCLERHLFENMNFVKTIAKSEDNLK